jgi:hypothetical protein
MSPLNRSGHPISCLGSHWLHVPLPLGILLHFKRDQSLLWQSIILECSQRINPLSLPLSHSKQDNIHLRIVFFSGYLNQYIG